MFEFSVSGMNIAGVGETATIIDTVPICKYMYIHIIIIIAVNIGG